MTNEEIIHSTKVGLKNISKDNFNVTRNQLSNLFISLFDLHSLPKSSIFSVVGKLLKYYDKMIIYDAILNSYYERHRFFTDNEVYSTLFFSCDKIEKRLNNNGVAMPDLTNLIAELRVVNG